MFLLVHLIREEIARESDLGKAVKNIVESGNYVNDETIVQCLMNHLKTLDQNPNNIVLLDGIPRNLDQAYTLNKLFGAN